MDIDNTTDLSNDADAFFDDLLNDAGVHSKAPAASDGLSLHTASAEELAAALSTAAPVAQTTGLSSEDLVLREVLLEFYRERNPTNLGSVDDIVLKYRGEDVGNLWAQLGVKYSIDPVHVVDLLARTLYLSTPSQCSDAGKRGRIQHDLEELGVDFVLEPSELMQKALGSSSEDVLRALVVRGGLRDNCSTRPLLWKVLLGYLPVARRDDWVAIQREKQTEYAELRKELQELDGQSRSSAWKTSGELGQNRDLLELLQGEVDAVAGSLEFSQKPSARDALVAILFVYAQFNSSIRYIQGMNETAAVILYVMLEGCDAVSIETEADAFWCFNALMAKIEDRFTDTLDSISGRVHSFVGSESSLLKKYDYELAKHLELCELEPGIFAARWFTLLFCGDVPISDLVVLWDSLLGDSGHCDLCAHVCVALLMSHREELLETRNVMALAEILQVATRSGKWKDHVARAWALCILERRTEAPVFPPLSAKGVVQEVAGAFFHGLFNKF